MKNQLEPLTAVFLVIVTTTATATIRYVDLNCTNATPPFTNWITAATNIQDAVDASADGDEVVVTNGVYASGGRAVYGTMTNRVAIDRAVLVRSVNGPVSTSIVGSGPNGSNAVRCVYMTNGAMLVGFTLTNGATQTAGDYATNQSGGGVWCTSVSAVISNCVLVGNSASYCGGGTWFGTLNNCKLTGNSASSSGGGAEYATLNNCTLTGNSAYDYGGGASVSTLNNCTLTGNRAVWYGGGASGNSFAGKLNNCIVYYNSAPNGANYYRGNLNYCCTTPLPSAGNGNVSAEPQLASTSHLSSNSPCRGAGSAAYVIGVDIDSEQWMNPPSIGCDEYWIGSVTGAVSAAIVASLTNAAVGFTVDFQALIEGRVSASRWDFADGVIVSNRPYTSHAWVAAGDYVVELRAYNESYPAGVTASVTVRVGIKPVHYVALTSTNSVPPYTNWLTAATNIQDAVDAADAGDNILVTNGVYATGARVVYGMSNRLAVDKPVVVQSVNGPAVTSIVGSGPNGSNAVRCVYMTNGAMLAGFTLTNGATQTAGDYSQNQSGGGVWCESVNAVVSNCVLVGNSASEYGGGTWFGALNNCTLTGNSASSSGGGAYYGTLSNCTLTTNSASFGGGAYYGTLNNCTLVGNSANSYAGGTYSSTLTNCTLRGNSASSFGGGAYLGTLNNCTLTTNSASFGGGAYSSTLNNCTLTGNLVDWHGGGAYDSTLNNCTLAGNSASHNGGGAYDGTLNNCTLTGNSTSSSGGGASISTLNNCTLVGNSAQSGGGTYGVTLNNCIVYYNTATNNNPNGYASTFANSCTTPLPGGLGNIADEPLFVDTNGWNNLRLQSNSPCINAGNNAYATNSTDLDGNPRLAGGTVDMGAYEFQGTGLSGFTGWLWQHGLRVDGTADSADSDGDTANNWREWVADTDPTNRLSVLKMLSPASAESGVTVSWQSVNTRSYFLERATDIGAQPPFQILQGNLTGQAGTTSYTDTNATADGAFFYRVGVQE